MLKTAVARLFSSRTKESQEKAADDTFNCYSYMLLPSSSSSEARDFRRPYHPETKSRNPLRSVTLPFLAAGSSFPADHNDSEELSPTPRDNDSEELSPTPRDEEAAPLVVSLPLVQVSHTDSVASSSSSVAPTSRACATTAIAFCGATSPASSSAAAVVASRSVYAPGSGDHIVDIMASMERGERPEESCRQRVRSENKEGGVAADSPVDPTPGHTQARAFSRRRQTLVDKALATADERKCLLGSRKTKTTALGNTPVS